MGSVPKSFVRFIVHTHPFITMLHAARKHTRNCTLNAGGASDAFDSALKEDTKQVVAPIGSNGQTSVNKPSSLFCVPAESFRVSSLPFSQTNDHEFGSTMYQLNTPGTQARVNCRMSRPANTHSIAVDVDVAVRAPSSAHALDQIAALLNQNSFSLRSISTGLQLQESWITISATIALRPSPRMKRDGVAAFQAQHIDHTAPHLDSGGGSTHLVRR